MKCRTCKIELTKDNMFKSFRNRINPIYLCKECGITINKKWLAKHKENRKCTQKNYFDKKAMDRIIDSGIQKMSIKRLDFLFENVLWENTPIYEGWKVI